MKILSLFDGISTGFLALKNLGFKIKKYYSCEIDKTALKISQYYFKNDIIYLGDIKNWKEWGINWAEIDLIFSGSPCQDLSIAGKKAGITGAKSKLFFTFVEILNFIKKLNPDVKFLQENVFSMSKIDYEIISQNLGLYPVMIDSARLTAQRRKRYYWTDIKVIKKYDLFGNEYVFTDIPQPNDRRIFAQNILTSGRAPVKKYQTLLARYWEANQLKDYKNFVKRVKTKSVPYVIDKDKLRLLNKIEMARLQGFPDWFCEPFSDKECAKVLGNAWTLPVIEHILKYLKN